MILGVGRAPGKVILFGEHAVVYGRPALAVPVTQVQAEAVVEPGERGAGLTIVAADLGETIAVRDAPADHPLAAAARLTLVKFGLDNPDWRVTVRSTIPIASGMGSGAAVSAAIVRAVVEAANSKLQIADPASQPNRVICSLQFAVCNPFPLWSTRWSGSTTARPAASTTPSSSTVSRSISCAGRPPQTFHIGRPFMLAIADTGIHSPTKDRGGGRAAGVGAGAGALRGAVRSGRDGGGGRSIGHRRGRAGAAGTADGREPCPAPGDRRLVPGARRAGRGGARQPGALGAKLSGGGRGGNMIALVTEETASQVADALRGSGRGAT